VGVGVGVGVGGAGRLQAGAYRVAALASLVWQKRKRSSLRPALKAYLEAMAGGNWQLAIGCRLVSSAVGVRWLTLLQLQKAALPSCV
jgi:hypothetical protein